MNLGGTDGANDLTIDVNSLGPTATFNGAVAATNKVVTYAGIALSGADSSNYSLTQHIDSADASTGSDGPYDINPREVALSATKIYDDSVIFDPSSSDDVITITTSTGETLTFTSATVKYKDVSTAGNHFTGIVLADGAATDPNRGVASNYVLPGTNSNSVIVANGDSPLVYDATSGSSSYNVVTVTPRDLTITASSISKTYGETVTFTGTEPEFTKVGNQGDDAFTVTLTSTGAVDTANAVDHNIVPSAVAVSSNDFDLSNYNVNYVSGTLTVNRKVLTLTGLTAEDKIYDGDNVATISSYGSLSGILSFDEGHVELPSSGLPTATFSDKNVNGDDEATKTVTLPLIHPHADEVHLVGTKAGNYSIGDQTTNNAKILKKELTLEATKVFENLRVIESGEITLGNYASPGGIEEALVISNANSMDSSADNLSSVNVNALNKYIDTSASTTLSDTTSGSAANYKLPPNAYDSVKNNLTITAAPLTISADDQSKTYGDADPTLTVNYSGDATGFDPSHVAGWSIIAPTNASGTTALIVSQLI